MPSVRVYVVCHKTSYPENADAADDRFRWYVVNAEVPDKTIRAPESARINEWDLPRYEAGLQAAGCREASALFHALANDQLRDADFIGFAQYDMRVPSAALDAFEAAVLSAEPGSPAKVGVGFPRPWDDVVRYGALPPLFWRELLGLFLPPGVPPPAEVPLFSTFVLPKEAFVEMMTAVNIIAPDIHTAIGDDTTHIAGTLERVFGIWIAANVAAGRLDAVVLPGLVHDQTQRC